MGFNHRRTVFHARLSKLKEIVFGSRWVREHSSYDFVTTCGASITKLGFSGDVVAFQGRFLRYISSCSDLEKRTLVLNRVVSQAYVAAIAARTAGQTIYDEQTRFMLSVLDKFGAIELHSSALKDKAATTAATWGTKEDEAATTAVERAGAGAGAGAGAAGAGSTAVSGAHM